MKTGFAPRIPRDKACKNTTLRYHSYWGCAPASWTSNKVRHCNGCTRTALLVVSGGLLRDQFAVCTSLLPCTDRQFSVGGKTVTNFPSKHYLDLCYTIPYFCVLVKAYLKIPQQTLQVFVAAGILWVRVILLGKYYEYVA